MNSQTLLSLLQISDSFFPTGGFTQSHGLETMFREGNIEDEKDLFNFLKAFLQGAFGSTDLVVFSMSYNAFKDSDIDEICQLDKLLSSAKVVREARETSAKSGRGMLRLATQLIENTPMKEYFAMVKKEKCMGHHAIAFSGLSCALGIDREKAMLAYTYTLCQSISSAALRLIPLPQGKVQKVLMRLQPIVLQVIEMAGSCESIYSFVPAIDIAGMKHERETIRLFIS